MKPATLFIALALSGTSVIARPSLSHPTFPSLKQLFTRISRFFHPLEAVDELVDAIPFLPSRDPHPWLVANAPHLARLRTALVAQQLCNTSSPLYLDPGRGRTPPPPDLFAAVAVDTNSRGYTSTAAGWWAALEALDALAACPPALAAATRLKVDVYVSTYVSGQGETSPLPPPEAVLRRFAAVLPRMRGLRDVAFGVPPEHAAALARVLAEADVRLPGVRRLRLGRGLEALVGMCPDVEEVVGGGYEDHWSWNHYVPGLAAGRTELVKAVGAAGRGKGGRVEGPGVLSTLRLDSGWNGWEDQQLLEGESLAPGACPDATCSCHTDGTDRLAAVVEFFPDVVTLEMKGILERGGYYDRGDATILRVGAPYSTNAPMIHFEGL